MLSKPAAIGLRITQAVCAIIVLGLVAYVVSLLSNLLDCGYYTCYTYSLDSPVMDFALFCAIWTILVGIWALVIAFTVKRGTYSRSAKTHQAWDWVTFGGDLISTLAWFAAFILLAVETGLGAAYVNYTESEEDASGAIGIFGAATAFAGVSWIFAMVLFIFDCLEIKERRRGGAPSLGGGTLTSQPPMAASEAGHYYHDGGHNPSIGSPSMVSPKPAPISETGQHYYGGGHNSMYSQPPSAPSDAGGYYNPEMGATVNAPVPSMPELDQTHRH